MSSLSPGQRHLRQYLEENGIDVESTPCNDYVDLISFSVSYSPGNLSLTAYIQPNPGNSISSLVVEITSADGSDPYCWAMTKTAATSPGLTGSTQAWTSTSLYDPASNGDQVTGQVSGVVNYPGGNACQFSFTKTVTVS